MIQEQIHSIQVNHLHQPSTSLIAKRLTRSSELFLLCRQCQIAWETRHDAWSITKEPGRSQNTFNHYNLIYQINANAPFELFKCWVQFLLLQRSLVSDWYAAVCFIKVEFYFHYSRVTKNQIFALKETMQKRSLIKVWKGGEATMQH